MSTRKWIRAALMGALLLTGVCAKTFAACPGLNHLKECIRNAAGEGSAIIDVYRVPSYDENLWHAITVATETREGSGVYWNIVIANISANTQEEARAIAENLFENGGNARSIGTQSQDGHFYCGYNMFPPYIAASNTPTEAPSDATREDIR